MMQSAQCKATPRCVRTMPVHTKGCHNAICRTMQSVWCNPYNAIRTIQSAQCDPTRQSTRCHPTVQCANCGGIHFANSGRCTLRHKAEIKGRRGGSRAGSGAIACTISSEKSGVQTRLVGSICLGNWSEMTTKHRLIWPDRQQRTSAFLTRLKRVMKLESDLVIEFSISGNTNEAWRRMHDWFVASRGRYVCVRMGQDSNLFIVYWS